MARQSSDDWIGDELLPRIKSRGFIAATLFWGTIWAICNFNPTVGLAFLIPYAGSIGLFGRGKRRREAADQDERGYQRALGHESEELARERVAADPVQAASPLLHRQIIADAAPAKVRLEASASVAEGILGEKLRNMVARVKDVESGLEQDPSRLSDVQRLFTYYLPATADLLSARGAIVGTSDTKRLAEIDAMIAKLDLAYTDFAARLKGHDARSLEIDLRLLEQSLNEELLTKTKA